MARLQAADRINNAGGYEEPVFPDAPVSHGSRNLDLNLRAVMQVSDGGGHALVVGGSGMLAGLCRALAAGGWQVTMVGRGRTKLSRAAGGDPRIHPLSADYEQIPAFVAALDAAAAAHGPIELAVCWIRTWAPQSLLAAASAVTPHGRLFHIIGSQRSEASAPAIAELERRGDLRYRQVQLGGVSDSGVQRWLTNEEISAGVYAAILADERHYLVGNHITENRLRCSRSTLHTVRPTSTSTASMSHRPRSCLVMGQVQA